MLGTKLYWNRCKKKRIYGDVIDAGNVLKLVRTIAPDEVYNLAAQSQVDLSFDLPEYTAQVNAVGVLNILEAIKHRAF